MITLGGDFVILTADPEDTPCDLYNSFIMNLTNVESAPNSVTTICFTSREGSFLNRTAELLSSAAAVFFTGGDQGKYYSFFKDSPVALLLPSVPLVGGSSAGLAVQGRLLFDALQGSVSSEDALKYPLDHDISLANDLFNLRNMNGVITDTHFYQRDRMGRLITFLARFTADLPSHPGSDQVRTYVEIETTPLKAELAQDSRL